jgi:hypothetical protein
MNAPVFANDHSIHAVALAFFDAGFPLIPLKPGSKWIRKDFGPTLRRVTTYGELYHQFVTLGSNLGLLTGGESGLCVLDVDDQAAYRQLVDSWPVLAATFTVQTASPGHYHVYTLVGDLPSGPGARFVEVKARGKVVVGPASVVAGKLYTPLDWAAPIVTIDPADFFFFSALTHKADVPLKKKKAHPGNDLVSRLKEAWSLLEVCESHGIKLAGSPMA